MNDSPMELLESAISSCEKEYAELCDNWRALDQKSQGLLQVAGVMIGLLAAFATKLQDGNEMPPLWHLAILATEGIAFVLLAVCTAFAVGALKVARVRHAPRGTGWEEMAVTCADAVPSNEQMRFIKKRLIDEWRKTNEDVWSVNETKASRLEEAQSWLFSAGVGISLAALEFLAAQAASVVCR